MKTSFARAGAVIGVALITLTFAACESAVAPEPASLTPNAEAALSSASSSEAAARNAEARKCLDGGYLVYTRADGSPFRNTGQCVAYAQHGGQLASVATDPPEIAHFYLQCRLSATGNPEYFIVASFTGAATGVVNPGGITVQSGVDLQVDDALGVFVLTVTNSAGSVSAEFGFVGYYPVCAPPDF